MWGLRRATAAFPGALHDAGEAGLAEGGRPNGMAVRRESGTAKVRLLWCSLFALVLFAIALPAFAAPQVWTAPSLVRVGPDDAAGTATDIQLYAAKGETESFQILIKAPAGGLTNANVIAPDLGGPQLTLYRENYAYLASGSADYASNQNHPLGAGWYPDGLIPFVNPDTGQDLTGTLDAVPFSLTDGKNQPIWVDVSVPRSTAAGNYSGTFQITSDQGSATVTLHLTVWNFTLPLKPALRSMFRYSQSSYSRDTQPARELIEHRLMPHFVSTTDERNFIDGYGLNNVGVPFYANASGGSIDPAPSAAQFQAEAAKHQPDLPLYCYMADEIGWNTAYYPTIKQWAQNMHTAGIDNLITMMPDPALYDDGSGTGRSAVDIWVLLPKQYDQVPDRVNDVIAKGDEVWSYNCNLQDGYSPKWELDFAPINYRIQPGFINQSLNLTGLLYWAVDYWGGQDPWTNPMPWSPFPAEGMLVYPGEDVGLPGQTIGSMRLNYLRDGVDDYDYIQLLKQQGLGDWALSVARNVGPDWRNWTRDPNALEAARVQLGQKLDSLGGGGGGTTSHTVNVSPSAAPTTVASGGQTALTASATDSQGHGIASWSWSDGGAGGSFSSTTAQSPTYTAPTNTSGANQAVTLTVTAVCDGSPAGTATAQTTVTVQPESGTSEHTLQVTATVNPVAIASGAQATLTATATDSLGHNIVSWSWSDGGAGGTFSPAATVQNPSYTPPASTTSLDITLRVVARCDGSSVLAAAGTAALSVAAAGPGEMTDVPSDYWAYAYIKACLRAGIMTDYADGTFQPTQPVSRADMAAFIARGVAGGDENVPAAPSESSFSDIPSDYWALRYIEYLNQLTIVQGYPNGTYRPDEQIDRAQLAVYMARALATPPGEAGLADYVAPNMPTFEDVLRRFWAYRYIENIAAQGLVNGYPDGTYRPSVTITRDQMAVYLARAFKLPM